MPSPRLALVEGQAPSLLRATVGGLEGFVAVEGDAAGLLWIEFRNGREQATRLDPPPDRWAAFWRAVDELDVWEWSERYEGHTTDSYCAARLQYEERVIGTDCTEGGTPPKWSEFCSAVTALAGRPFNWAAIPAKDAEAPRSTAPREDSKRRRTL